MNLLFTVPLRKEVKKLSLILAGEVDFEAPKDTHIQSPTTVTVSSCYDIREIVSLGGLEKLSSHEKYSILKNHFKPYKTYVFLKVHLHGCQRSCKIEYLHSSFVHSKKEDAVYCIIVHCFHTMISEEHWGLLLILDIKVGITFMKNKHCIW